MSARAVDPCQMTPLDSLERSIFVATVNVCAGWPQGVALVAATRALVLLAEECAQPGHARDAIEGCAELLKFEAESFPRGRVQ